MLQWMTTSKGGNGQQIGLDYFESGIKGEYTAVTFLNQIIPNFILNTYPLYSQISYFYQPSKKGF